MAVKRVTSSKRDREKAKQSKREEKQKRKEERLSSGSRSFEEMLAYVDENGILHSTPEGVKPKEEIDASEIEISIPKKGEAEEILPLNGRIEHFNVSRGYGFIKDLEVSFHRFSRLYFACNTVLPGNYRYFYRKFTAGWDRSEYNLVSFYFSRTFFDIVRDGQFAITCGF